MTTKVGFCGECGIIRQDTDGVPDTDCACMAKRAGHTDKCAYYCAVASKIGFSCDHGYDVCPDCDKCTCGVGGAKACGHSVAAGPVTIL